MLSRHIVKYFNTGPPFSLDDDDPVVFVKYEVWHRLWRFLIDITTCALIMVSTRMTRRLTAQEFATYSSILHGTVFCVPLFALLLYVKLHQRSNA